MEKTEFRELIDGCLRNQRSYQEKLYKAFYDFACGIALRYASDRNQASIIVNKGFYNAFVSINKYKGIIDFKEWLRNFIVQASIKHYLDKSKPHVLTPEPNSDNIKIGSYSFENGLSADDRIKMLQQLPDLDRLVFNLFAIEGYSHEKIASSANISVPASIEILANAREKLKSFISSE
jgi:RNA polymerase sigma factor (sigma-70 family)